MHKTLFQRIQSFVVGIIAKIHWPQRRELTDGDRDFIRELLIHDYFIIATRRSNYLSAFFINLGHFLLTGRWGFFTHLLMNLEDEVQLDSDFRLIEAATVGTKYSTFDEVFEDVDAVALLKPRSMKVEEWTACMETCKTHLGKPYDNLFDVNSDAEINCVELVRIALKTLPDYKTRFKNFERMLASKKTLTPHMFLECEDFHIFMSIKR